jgi:hypothetical protein
VTTQTRARQRPEPAGEPAPVTIDPPATPVEDVPAVATPEPAPAPEPEQDTHSTTVRALVEQGQVGVGALLRPDVDEPVPVFGADRLPDDDLVDDHPLSAAEALAEVMRRVRPIEKGRRAAAEVGGYAFRGIDDVYAALHDLFGEVGLVVLPSTIERLAEQRPKARGDGVNYVTHLHVRFRFLAADGTSEQCDAWGEGSDTGDKGTGKAHSQAAKSALLAAFLIPTEASSNDDPDATGPEPSRPWTMEERERANTALAAAREATTFEQLVGVRRRAEHLLDVPIVEDDGTIAPLRLHLDALRTQIEGRVQS